MDLNEYFRTETNKKLERIESKLDRLSANYFKFKWKTLGGQAVIAAIASALMLVIFGR